MSTWFVWSLTPTKCGSFISLTSKFLSDHTGLNDQQSDSETNSGWSYFPHVFCLKIFFIWHVVAWLKLKQKFAAEVRQTFVNFSEFSEINRAGGFMFMFRTCSMSWSLCRSISFEDKSHSFTDWSMWVNTTYKLNKSTVGLNLDLNH